MEYNLIEEYNINRIYILINHYLYLYIVSFRIFILLDITQIDNNKECLFSREQKFGSNFDSYYCRSSF